jgi:hypothetical protein
VDIRSLLFVTTFPVTTRGCDLAVISKWLQGLACVGNCMSVQRAWLGFGTHTSRHGSERCHEHTELPMYRLSFGWILLGAHQTIAQYTEQSFGSIQRFVTASLFIHGDRGAVSQYY